MVFTEGAAGDEIQKDHGEGVAFEHKGKKEEARREIEEGTRAWSRKSGLTWVLVKGRQRTWNRARTSTLGPVL